MAQPIGIAIILPTYTKGRTGKDLKRDSEKAIDKGRNGRKGSGEGRGKDRKAVAWVESKGGLRERGLPN